MGSRSSSSIGGSRGLIGQSSGVRVINSGQMNHRWAWCSSCGDSPWLALSAGLSPVCLWFHCSVRVNSRFPWSGHRHKGWIFKTINWSNAERSFSRSRDKLVEKGDRCRRAEMQLGKPKKKSTTLFKTWYRRWVYWRQDRFTHEKCTRRTIAYNEKSVRYCFQSIFRCVGCSSILDTRAYFG